jgi:hypothetical protein
MNTSSLFDFVMLTGAKLEGFNGVPLGDPDFVLDRTERRWRRVRDPGAARLVASQLGLFTVDPTNAADVISRTRRPLNERAFWVYLLPKDRPGTRGAISIPLAELLVFHPALGNDPGIRAMLGRLPGIDAATLADEGDEAARQIQKSARTNAKADAVADRIQSFDFERDVSREVSAGLGRIAGGIIGFVGSTLGAGAGAFLASLPPVGVVALVAVGAAGAVVVARKAVN